MARRGRPRKGEKTLKQKILDHLGTTSKSLYISCFNPESYQCEPAFSNYSKGAVGQALKTLQESGEIYISGYGRLRWRGCTETHVFRLTPEYKKNQEIKEAKRKAQRGIKQEIKDACAPCNVSLFFNDSSKGKEAGFHGEFNFNNLSIANIVFITDLINSLDKK